MSEKHREEGPPPAERLPAEGEARAGQPRRRADAPPQRQRPPENRPPGKRGKKRKRRRSSPLKRFLLKLLLFTAILAGVFTFVLGVHIHHGNRMYPFIMDGDLLITYKLDPYRVGDAVAYRNPQTGEMSIARIVAIGEGEIEITEIGELLVNGYIPAESVFYPTKELDGSEITFPYAMSRDGVFLLDDYREIGMDSRAFGEVGKGDLQGKVVYVFRRRGI